MYFRADRKTAVRTLIDRKARQHIPSELMIFKTLLYIVDLFKADWTIILWYLTHNLFSNYIISMKYVCFCSYFDNFDSYFYMTIILSCVFGRNQHDLWLCIFFS